MPHEAEHEALQAHLEKHRLKRTKQREVILDAFLASKGHVSSEELYDQIRADNPNVGFTTVYRTMKLLVDAGIAQERHFDDGLARYELEREHHDHLVCVECGRIVEFECDVIEERQRQIAKEHDFDVERHRHELYGRCRDCRGG